MIKVGNFVKCKNPHNLDSVITVGKFGVLHVGHKKILEAMKETKLYPIIFSFSPSPVLFFSKNNKLYNRIFSYYQVNSLLNQYFDNDVLYFIQKFNLNFSSITPEVFIQLLVQNFNLKHLILGSDFSFGVNRSGDLNLIQKLSSQYNFKVSIISKKDNISTTLLRNFLQEGRVKDFNNLSAFDEKYKITGKVIKGAGIAGNILGYKTANIALSKKQALPMFGVYAVSVLFDGINYKGIGNIGLKPTVSNVEKPILEVHILNFNQDIYDKNIEISFLNFIRKEKKFATLHDLKEQIKIDITQI